MNIVLRRREDLRDSNYILNPHPDNQYWANRVGEPTASLPVMIFTHAISPYEDWHRQAWAGAFLLVMMILVLSIAARLAVRRLERMNRP